MTERLQAKLNRHAEMLIIVGLTSLVEDHGYTPHQAFEILEDVKRQTWHALSEIHRGEG
ncbi:hypothetical protein ACFQ3J_00265 [Paenibacillus provencensis]|uniref:Spo0E like sporulation regulatory protein n=1 Tax=Paenibacillus provencensis TaxID=441151 RepID=A0ABW3PMU5_9BACL|nr:hypothetical protein [Paenibacillus sp. MER 78]MCM3130971.1 hypothetical protein [Paenibacillus sp. MER 78]